MSSRDIGLAGIWTSTRNLSTFIPVCDTAAVVGRFLGIYYILLCIGLLDGDVDIYDARRYVIWFALVNACI